MFGTMASAGSKQLLQLGRNISYFGGRSCALYRCPMQPSQHTPIKNTFFSSPAAAIDVEVEVEVEEPVKNTTYSDLIRNRNKPSEEPDKKSVEKEKKPPFTYGHIRGINREKGYAIIRDEVSNEQIHLKFTNIDISESAQHNAKFVNPVFSSGARVRFQVMPNPINSGAMSAYDVQRWNGNKIPLLHYKDALKIALRSRAWLGHRCYEILDEEQDAAAMSEQIRQAYEDSNKSTEWARSQLTDSNKIIRECKAELGNEVFDILENIYQIDDVQRKVEEAFLRCERTLKELELLGIREEEEEPRQKRNPVVVV